MLQEVRVCQTGAQILFGFLLSVVFTARFTTLPVLDRHLCVATVLLGAFATGALVALAAFHRFFAGHGLKPELVHAAGHLISTGLVLLALTITSAMLLLLRNALHTAAAASALSGVVLLGFTTCWLVLPNLVPAARSPSARARHG
ncbi:DUF6328 family protein [Kitasatospora sp. NPDC051164]|uniref:DUF6328 family protein n=1 Tax=Kitasatospora sp. NPDC051164 TaxID=3364055 RepID=UPI00378F063E